MVMKFTRTHQLFAGALVGALVTVFTTASAQGTHDRTSLPIPEPARQTYKELDARNAKARLASK